MTITVQAGITAGGPPRGPGRAEPAAADRCPAARPGDARRRLRDQHERPAAVRPGRPRDQIIGVSFVTSEGIVVKGGGRVVKNVAGYDFPKLLTGSMGTLGIITQMTLKVRPIPEASAIVWVAVPTARRPGRDARPAQHVGHPADRPRAAEPLGRAGWSASRSDLPADGLGPRRRLRGQRRVGRLAGRPPEDRAGPAPTSSVRRGRRRRARSGRP